MLSKATFCVIPYSPSLFAFLLSLCTSKLTGATPLLCSLSIAVALSCRCITPSKHSGIGMCEKYITVKSYLVKRFRRRARSSIGIASKS